MEQSMQASRSDNATKRQRDSTYGVQSLADTLETAFGSEPPSGDSSQSSAPAHTSSSRLAAQRPSHDSSRSVRRDLGSSKLTPHRPSSKKTSAQSSLHPCSPLNTESRSPVAPSAMPSTPRSVSLQSLKLSDEEGGFDESASQVITSSGDEEEETTLEESGSFPQLVMPSLQMPSRRPFTTKGKAMGKLKVLVAGQAGTSLPLRIMVYPSDISRHRQNISHKVYCATMRRYRPRRPSLTIQLNSARAAAKAAITEKQGRGGQDVPYYRDACEHKVIPTLVDRC